MASYRFLRDSKCIQILYIRHPGTENPCVTSSILVPTTGFYVRLNSGLRIPSDRWQAEKRRRAEKSGRVANAYPGPSISDSCSRQSVACRRLSAVFQSVETSLRWDLLAPVFWACYPLSVSPNLIARTASLPPNTSLDWVLATAALDGSRVLQTGF